MRINRRLGARALLRSEAFTLIELAVVLAILALLALLTLPSLARTDHSSTRLVCRNNLRQMGLAVTMYATDNRDYLPWPNWGAVNMLDGQPGPGWLYTPVVGAPPNLGAAPYNTDPMRAFRTGLLFPYVKAMPPYQCAVNLESRYYPARANKLSAYIMQGAVCGYGSTYRTTKITQVWNPSCYLMWEPDENLGNPPIGAFAYNDGSSYPDSNEGIGRLHSMNGGDVVSVDGRVSFVSLRTWAIQSTNTAGPGGKSLTWWSPFSSPGH
jgi:prepilin-type N-terminal cleavage/methylation domain-containing protein